MTEELARQLRDAGFPQKANNTRGEEIIPNPFRTRPGEDEAFLVGDAYYFPSLNDLIEALGDDYQPPTKAAQTIPDKVNQELWIAMPRNRADFVCGLTQEEALARLWLALRLSKTQGNG